MTNEKKNKLLIVDDEINVLKTLQFIFEESGFDVTMVSSGIDAVNKAKEETYDLALLDINMPEMDGLETFRQIKKVSPSTAVIMMTGNKENIQIKKSIEEGAYTVVYKPFAINQLLEIMDKVLEVPIVLVVDDRSEDRFTLRNSLEIEDYRVVEAESGEDALEKIKNGKYDIFLVDYKMPGINGVETIEEIKKVKPEAAVILMSGYTLEEAIKKQIEEQETLAFVKKPYEIEHLVDIIKNELSKNNSESD